MAIIPEPREPLSDEPKTVFVSERSLLIFSFILCAVMLFYQLGGMALISPDEGRNAEVAREMSDSHAWLTPTYDGLTYLDKPAFYFKTVALSFALLGESEGVARLSSALFGFFLLIAVFLFCRRVYDQRTAMLAMLIVAGTPLYIAFSRIVIFDMSLAFFVCSAIFACYLAEEDEPKYRSRWYSTAAAAAAVATLIKGPVGFILPTLVITIFNALEGRLHVMKQAFTARNWLIFFVIFLPWFVGLSILHPDFPYYGIVKESISRFTTHEFRRTQPFYFYALIIASTFFPWSLLLPESIYTAWRDRKHWHRADRLFIVWAIAVVGFFSISQSKLPGYILTAVLALGILTARLFSLALKDGEGRAGKIIRRGALALLGLTAIAAIITTAVVVNPEIAMSRLHYKPEVMILFYPAMLPLALTMAVVALLTAWALWQKSTKTLFAAFLSIPLSLATVNFDLLSIYGETRSARALAEQIPPLSEATEVACLECMPNGLPFYLKRLITVVTEQGGEIKSNYIHFMLKSADPWPPGVVPIAQWESWLSSRDHPVYLLARGHHLPSLTRVAEKYDVAVMPLSRDYFSVLIPTPERQ